MPSVAMQQQAPLVMQQQAPLVMHQQAPVVMQQQVPVVMQQQGLGGWQVPLTGFPTSFVVPTGNFNQSGEKKEVIELRKLLDEEKKFRKDLCIQNSREVTSLRGDCKQMKHKRKMLEEDLKAEKKKREESETSLDKVKEEKWYAVKEVKEKVAELEREQNKRKLAEKKLEDMKVELDKEREKRRAAEKRIEELESRKGGKAAEVASDPEKLERERRVKKAHEKREEYLLKEKLKEKNLVKGKLDDESEEDHWEWEGRGVGMVVSKRRRGQSCGIREQESSCKSKAGLGEEIIKRRGEENRAKAVKQDANYSLGRGGKSEKQVGIPNCI